jgi:AcrR family transcriptional regulator
MPIPERRERDRTRRRQLIVRAARELAEAEGWEAVTTRRLAERVEYSQPVLYSHFTGKADIVRAVALEGFGDLAAKLRSARTAADSPAAALRALAAAYLRFAQSHPAVYDAMFVMPIDLPFAVPGTPAAPRAAFAELLAALTPLAEDRDLETLGEVAWSALQGLATLARSNRLRASHHQARLDLLVDQLTGRPAQHRPGGHDTARPAR